MSYQITKNEPIETSLKNILVSGIKDAASVLSLSQGLHREQFKQARKSLKKARAVLFLLRGSISDEKFAKEEKSLRSLSRTFRDVRDAHVTEEVFQKLLDAHQKSFKLEEIHEIKLFLVEESKRTVEKVFKQEKKLREAIGLLQAAMERIPEIKVKRDVWESIDESLRSIYHECLDLSDYCQETDDEEMFIEWRKAVKFLRVELDFFLEGLSPETKKWNRSLHELSDVLGEFQDLTMIQEQLDENRKDIKNKKALELILSLIKEKKKALRKNARLMGKEVFSEKPKSFMKEFSSSTISWFKAA